MENNLLISNKIYTIRGQKVMLDSDLAEIYGYTTKAFNQQVKNNLVKFEGEDFMFQLTKEELEIILRSKNLTSNAEIRLLRSKNLISMQIKSKRGGRSYLPYAFTESGIYMLMTVLRGELATKQSRTLIRLFRELKNYYLENQDYSLVSQVIENKHTIEKIQVELDNTLKKTDISPILLNFSDPALIQEFVFFNGELTKATETYIDIYASAKKSIHIIDDYISIKTLRYLRNVHKDIEVTIFTDNKANTLRKSDCKDFKREYPQITINFIKTNNIIHDRFIIIDNNKYYHSGASLKDAGNKVCMINLLESDISKRSLDKIIERLTKNEKLELR